MKWLITLATLQHYVWGFLLLSSNSPLGVTAISSVVHLGIISGSAAGLLYLAVSLLAMSSLFVPREVGIIFILPQQLLLSLAAFGAITAMVTGMYADGVPRPYHFIIADQLFVILLAGLHLLSIINNYWPTKLNPLKSYYRQYNDENEVKGTAYLSKDNS